MFQTTAQELSSKTLVYWKLSQVWNGKRKVNLPTGEAIGICQELYDRTAFYRPLAHRVDGLLQEIIKGEGTKREPAVVHILKRG